MLNSGFTGLFMVILLVLGLMKMFCNQMVLMVVYLCDCIGSLPACPPARPPDTRPPGIPAGIRRPRGAPGGGEAGDYQPPVRLDPESGPEYEALPAGATVTTHMVAGAVAGILEHCVMYPIDCVKVRPGPGCEPDLGLTRP